MAFIIVNTPVKSAERILDILELFACRAEALALRDVAAALALPKSSALMLLRTLEARSYIERGEDDRYRLNPVFRESGVGGVGWVGGNTMRLVRAAMPVMRSLVDGVEETAVLAVLTPELDVRVVANIPSPLAIRYDMSRLAVIPSYCTALGHTMLAFSPAEEVERYIARCSFEPLTDKTITDAAALRERLAEIRRRGWALNMEERFVGAVGCAAPILGPRGEVAGAVNIGTVTVRFRRNRRHIVAAVQAAAAEISRELGGGEAAQRPLAQSVGS